MSTWLRLHAQAFTDALGRILGQPLASAISIMVLGLALALPLLATVLLRTAASATAMLETDPHVNVYLALDAADDDVKRVEHALRSSPEAASLKFVSRSQALEELKARTHLAEVLASLERNPLPHAFIVRTRALDAAGLARAKTRWASLPRVDQVVADFEWSQRLQAWLGFGEKVVAGFSMLLAIAMLFIVGHLIRLQVLTRRDEIEVSQLIGATARDVRRKFLHQGAMQGALAGAAAVALALITAHWLSAQMRALAPNYAADLKVLIPGLSAAGLLILVTALLGVFAAWIAVGRELRAFSRNR
jgi:cell division transport system permease protein